jgi:two-component system sensor histidine kinase YesM
MMIREIQNLIKSVIAEQKTIRKAELNVLQAQIKPHFLYNTLDSINSLALSGRINEVCDLVDALGGYYRHSVSKGREVITLREELDIVKNYLKILKVRYEDMFEVNYNIGESCLDTKILKLVLQPLVENALYHGIRAKGVPGSININIMKEAQQVCICIEDNGVGMSDNEIQKILDSKVGSAESSFGLRGTIERLRIYCNNEDTFRLYSEKGKGTKIIILLPLVIEGETWDKSEQENGGNYVPTIESFNSR